MKKYFWLLLSLIWLLWTSVFATYEEFSRQLGTMWLDIQAIESQSSISRYDLARLLNMVECKDCITPKQDMIDKYIQNFWSTFTVLPGKDFADISFLWGKYNSLSYYYCVAYVGDNTYMRWYPKATSPVCGGQFCGSKNTTTAEFIQVVINILAKYIYKDINLNRKEVNTRVSKLKVDSYEAKNFNSDDRKIITEKSKNCENICALQNNNEVNVYLKYCMFNVGKCEMQEVGKIKQWYWPVAELNLLRSQSIININQSQRASTAKDIDGKTVLETLFKLNSKIDCAFNNDYDCDGINNAKDSCANTYSPSQKDFDHDGIGDVCDDDIDNDGINNPVGIIDEEGKIDISKLEWSSNQGGTGQWSMDNCLFVVNTNQENADHNGIGDACENLNNQIWLYININKIEGSAPLTTTFTAVSEGKVNEVQRDFGDGTQGKWTPITHIFLEPGMYNIQAIAKGDTSDAKAQVIVIVGGKIGDDKALQTRASLIGWEANIESTLSTSLLGVFDEIQRSFPKENSSFKKTINETVKKIFTQSGENPVMVKGYSNGILAGISYFTVGIDEWKWAILKSNSANPEINEKVLFDTKTYNITQADIVSVDRDFGDDNKESNSTLTLEYIYKTSGKKIITQIITTIDGKKLTNMLTINVGDKSLLWSYALLMVPSTLIADVGEKINFNTRIIGTLLKTPLIQIIEFADGITQKKSWTEKMPSLFVHTYQKNGALTPQDSVHIDQCAYLNNQATIAVNGTDNCLDAKLNWTLNTLYKCDLDGDKIPDICDTDIDNDWIKNLLGIINFENKDCSYVSNGNGNSPNTSANGNIDTINGNIDTINGNLNQRILGEHYQGMCSLDNSPFKNNSDQLDLNQDGIGDSNQDTAGGNTGDNNNNENEIDTDGDGIPDVQDLCPTIQETWNGTTDEDGCPEANQELWCNQIVPIAGTTNDILIVKPTVCNQCPCQFSDFANDLTNNDQVRAVLRDNKKTIQYKISLPWIVDF